jgi:hypothetical protein
VTGDNGRILFDRPKPTVGCSASGRRRRDTMQVGNVRHFACGFILQKIHFHLYVDCYPLMSTLCVLGRTLSLCGNSEHGF